MATAIEYALMAGVAYRSNRGLKNRFPIPSGWNEVPNSYRNLSGQSGFEATSFTNGTDMLVGGADNDTLDGGANNDILKGGAGNDTYSFTGGFGTDIVTDSDGSGGIKANGQTLGGGAQQKLKDIYQDEASGYTYVKLNDGTSLAILKEGEANRILVTDWSAAKSLGISLTGDVPTAPAATLAGDFKKKIDGHNTSATDDDTYVIDANNNYTPDPDNPVEANALDLISGTAGDDVIDGGGGKHITFCLLKVGAGGTAANDERWRMAA